MKLPGEAWLEFSIDRNNVLTQTATFRPLGVLGRLYWYSVAPLHGLVFRGMINQLAKADTTYVSDPISLTPSSQD